MNGWVALHRCITEKVIWLDSTPEQKTILVTLLLMANHKEQQWTWNGEKFTAKPGQFVTSIDNIAKRSGRGITKQIVRTALVKFEKLEFLTNQSTKTGRLITLVNWDLYQGDLLQPNIASNKELTKHQQRPNKDLTPNNNDNNDNNVINNTPPIVPPPGEGVVADFDTFWKVYPKKRSKGQAEKTWEKIKPDEQLLATMLATIEQAKTSVDWTKDGGKYIPYPATWLNAKGWNDEYSNTGQQKDKLAEPKGFAAIRDYFGLEGNEKEVIDIDKYG